MVAGGVGLAPFATLAEALSARAALRPTLFYGARRAGELLLRSSSFADARRRRWCSPPRTAARGEHGRVDGAARRRRALADVAPTPAPVHRSTPAVPSRCCAAVAAARRPPRPRRAKCRVERDMGCGMGGCYSCVVPVVQPGRRAALRPLVPRRPVFDGAAHRLGGADALTARSSVAARSVRASGRWRCQNPLIAASGCFGYGVEYRRRRSTSRRSAASA